MELSADLFDPELGDALIEADSADALGELLLRTAQRFDAITEVFGYRSSGAAPQALLSCSDHDDAQWRKDEYVERFYRNDPALWARRDVRDGGFVSRVRASEIALRDYRAICFDRPRFADKLCFGWRRGGEELVLSFYRHQGGELRDNDRLNGLAIVGLTALARLARGTPRRDASLHTDVSLVEHRLAERFPILSARERQACARTLAGWTAERIAGEFGLSKGTVLTYRQRAYAKLGIASAAQLLPTLLH